MTAVRTTTTTGVERLAEQAWDTLAAEAGTVFHTSRFLSTWWSDAAAVQPGSELRLIQVLAGSDHIGQCAVESRGDELRFAGGHDVVDYMGPVAAAGREAEVATAIVDAVVKQSDWRTAVFDGLVGSDPMTGLLVGEFGQRDLSLRTRCYDHAPRIRRGPTAYLARLNAKHRKEVLRKRSRLAEAIGEVRVLVDGGPAALERLLAWKAQATPETHGFVDRYGQYVRQLVHALGGAGEAHVVELVGGDRPLAAAIVLSFRGTRYLYNMSYDLAWLETAPPGLSPGVVLASHLAEETVNRGDEFDFLKGGQGYKLQLGGVPEELTRLQVNR